mmetsp:Transcript_61330/g.146056  ORF Transcript_61330/g.146056 Transcript_61330/m.146056 type:complete len:230 (-) Transcript_61330:295-984(-)
MSSTPLPVLSRYRKQRRTASLLLALRPPLRRSKNSSKSMLPLPLASKCLQSISVSSSVTGKSPMTRTKPSRNSVLEMPPEVSTSTWRNLAAMLFKTAPPFRRTKARSLFITCSASLSAPAGCFQSRASPPTILPGPSASEGHPSRTTGGPAGGRGGHSCPAHGGGCAEELEPPDCHAGACSARPPVRIGATRRLCFSSSLSPRGSCSCDHPESVRLASFSTLASHSRFK